MARPIREDYPGAWHHVMNRGARRAAIFKNDDHCMEFLFGLQLMVEKYGIEVHGYSLMPNHYHLLVRSSPDMANLSRAVGDFLGSYSQRVNSMHSKWDGPVFRGRFKSRLVKQESYLIYLLAYMHLNPVRAHLVGSPEEDCWTSHRSYLRIDREPDWLSCDLLLKQFGGRRGLRKTVNGLQRGAIPWPEFMDMRTGIFNWSEAPQEAGKSKEVKLLPEKPSVTIKSTLDKVCEITGSKKADLKKSVMGPRANPARRFAVWALWNMGLLTHRQIGEALGMTTVHVSKQLSRIGKKFPDSMKPWRKTWEKDA